MFFLLCSDGGIKIVGTATGQFEGYRLHESILPARLGSVHTPKKCMPKKKGTPGGNPNPVQTPAFIACQHKAQDGFQGKLSKRPLSVMVPVEIDAAVRSLPQKAAWLRRVITEAAKRELIDRGVQS